MVMFQKIWREMLNVLFPPLCVACRRKILGSAVCADCENSIELRSGFSCPECGRRLPEATRCHGKFILAAAASYQNEAVRELVHVLKYQNVKSALLPLAGIINEYLKKLSAGGGSAIGGKIQNFIIVPVPLYPKRERERGFNQAELIAGILNGKLGIAIQNDNLMRVRNTESQIKTKSYGEREKNVAGGFKVRRPMAVAGKNVILVDDVFTSGATMREAVRVLKEAGAKKIIGFVVAKA
ncbi:MAG: ComF family protein [Candidatus Brennerbacteria bacterium]|nr:ComF family protein [Candidatus Brennerbacteria bacterium]